MTDRPIAALPWLYVRSLFAVIAGLVVMAFFSVTTDRLMQAADIIPRGATWSGWHNLLALTYRSAFALLGGYVTAWLAPVARMRHVAILGAIGALAGAAGVMATWNIAGAPRLYLVALAVTVFPLVWLGGWLYLRQRRTR